MNDTPPTLPARWNWAGPALIALAVVAAYANSLSGPFVFDDLPSIVGNESIRSLAGAWFPPGAHGETVSGRPLLNVTFALNHAAGALQVRGYHFVNLALHLVATLLLFGVVRRLLLRSPARERGAAWAGSVAAWIAVLWAVHPVQTAAVTYIVQRAEVLCSCCYLATLYCFLRGAERSTASPRRREGAGWFCLAVLACLAGMASKEVMVTAPVMVLLIDRVLIAGSWRDVRRRWPVHAALALTWALLALLVSGSHGRAGSAGFNSAVGALDYLRTQLWAVPHYLRLLLWPAPLVFDYGVYVVPRWSDVLFPGAVVLAVAVVTTLQLWRARASGLLGIWFLLLLAPSSSLVPVSTQTVAEHRVYLAAAALIAAAVLMFDRVFRRYAWAPLTLLCLAAVVATHARNRSYVSTFALWSDTVAKRPENARAQLNLGVEYSARGDLPAALGCYGEAVRLSPEDSDALNNLANALNATGERAEALRHYSAAVQFGPRNAKARHNFANALAAAGRWSEARAQLEEVVSLDPTPGAYSDLGRTLAQLEDPAGAESAYRAALAKNPAFVAALVGLGELYARTGRPAEAEARFREALQREPNSAAAHGDLGRLLLLTRRAGEAVSEFEAALRQEPDSAAFHAQLGAALAITGRIDEGERELQNALRLDPNDAFARDTLVRVQRAKAARSR